LPVIESFSHKKIAGTKPAILGCETHLNRNYIF